MVIALEASAKLKRDRQNRKDTIMNKILFVKSPPVKSL